MPSGSKAHAPVGWLRVAFEGINGGTDWAVVHWFHAEETTEPTLAQLNTLVDSISAAYATNFVTQGHISNEVTLTRVKANLSIPDPPAQLKTVRVASAVGTGAGDAESGQVCFLINWQTTDGRRGGKARSYVPGVRNTDMLDQAHIVTGVVNAMSTFADAYHNAVNALTGPWFSAFHMIDASFVNDHAYRTTPVGFEVFSGVCSNVVGTQRRRVDRLRLS